MGVGGGGMEARREGVCGGGGWWRRDGRGVCVFEPITLEQQMTDLAHLCSTRTITGIPSAKYSAIV